MQDARHQSVVSNRPTVTGGPPTAVASGGARPSVHGPPGYGRGHGYRDAEYEFEPGTGTRKEMERERTTAARG